MISFITNAYAAAPAVAEQQAGNPWVSTAIMIALLVGLYFLMIRPQTKRAKEHRDLVTKLSKGDEVVTSGGILGKITNISDDFISLSIAEGIEVKIQRNAISTVLPKGTLKAV